MIYYERKSFLQLQAYDTIKNSILSGTLEPNRLYSETKLSAQIGISRTPMREALQCLSQDGYITIIPSKGFMIRQLNEKDMKDSIEIRCAIEGFCTNQIALQIATEKGRQLLHNLRQTLSCMERTLNQEDQLNPSSTTITSSIFFWSITWKMTNLIKFFSVCFI